MDDAAQADCVGPPSIWRTKGNQRGVTGVPGDGDAGGNPCTGLEEGREGVTVVPGDGDDGGGPCTAEGANLHLVLGGRDLGFDDPEGDPFTLLEEEDL